MTAPSQPAWGLTDAPITRRRALQLAGAAGAAAFLAATGVSRGARAQVATATAQPVTGGFRMASWTAYMDVAADGGWASVERFTDETGIEMDYQEIIEGNEEFFASDLRGPIDAGVDTGWDIVVLTDWMIQRLVNLQWLERIDTSGMVNYPTNLRAIYKTREWDSGNTFAAPYQSGMTGLGFDKGKTGELTSLDSLFTDQFAGKVTYLTDPRDTVGLSALRLGYDPSVLTQEQWDASLAVVKHAVDTQIVRTITGQSYIEDMVNGDAVLAVAWSGDVLTLLVPDQKPEQDFQWRLAEQGGMLWSDNMAIPKGARNQPQAQVWIDWYYKPANAAGIEAAVNYVCPVEGADAEILAIDPNLASNVLIFPTPDMLARLYQFRSLELETATVWEDAFSKVMGQ